jgi:hypothetical protein
MHVAHFRNDHTLTRRAGLLRVATRLTLLFFHPLQQLATLILIHGQAFILYREPGSHPEDGLFQNDNAECPILEPLRSALMRAN